MADNILRLKVESSEYDAKLKKAAEGIRHLAEVAHRGAGELTGLEKSEVDYIRALGEMETKSRTASGQVRELSSTYKELKVVYNQLNEVEKADEGGTALAASLETLKTRAQAAKQELKDIQKELDGGSNTSGGWLSGLGGKLGGAMQVFGGNLLTKATMEVANLGSEMVETVKQGIELARQGEGIRNAFARLGRGDILDGLRQATHGTVTDLELMKAAVKFNDFRLPLDQLGTMLAFAQQKAKDTGQSVDFLVDSIVNGLGRKSLMILDNLGLSASEIRERMKETGDMTTAVGAIIREQMAKAGDYMETAADRAAQANVNLQNKLEEVGRKFAPIEEASTQLWTSMKIGILDVVGGPLARLLNGLTEAGRLANAVNKINNTGGGQTHIDRVLGMLKHYSGDKEGLYNRQVEKYNREINWRRQYAKDIRDWQSGKRGSGLRQRIAEGQRRTGTDFLDSAEMDRQANAWTEIRNRYQAGAQSILNPIKLLPPSSDTTTVIPTKTGKGGGKTNIREEVFPEGSMKDLQRDMQELQKAQDLVTSPDEWQKYQQQIDAVTEKMNTLKGVAQKAPEMAEGVSGLNQKAIATYQSMLQESMKGMEYGSTDLTKTLANSIDVTTLSNLLTATLQQGIDMTAIKLEDGQTAADLWDKILGGKNIDDSTWESLRTVINEKLAEMGIDPIKLDFKTGEVKQISNDAKDMTKQWQNAGTAILAVGSAMSQIEDPAAKVIGTIAQAVATVALGYAQASSKAAELGPWGWIAFAAAGMATMVSMISTIHSATGYAQGGIVDGSNGGFVGGSQFSGDQVGNVRLNSGELVLSRSQQYNLASQLEGDGSQGTTPSRPYVSGEQIYLGLNNYLRRSGRGEIVTSR